MEVKKHQMLRLQKGLWKLIKNNSPLIMVVNKLIMSFKTVHIRTPYRSLVQVQEPSIPHEQSRQISMSSIFWLQALSTLQEIIRDRLQNHRDKSKKST